MLPTTPTTILRRNYMNKNRMVHLVMEIYNEATRLQGGTQRREIEVYLSGLRIIKQHLVLFMAFQLSTVLINFVIVIL